MEILNIIDYGAIADGRTVCTKEIQRAIDTCPKGGTVKIPKGTFRSGDLYLKSNMTLYLEEGARLLGSDNVEDFPIKGYPFEGLDQLCYTSLLNTDGAPYENITIEGKGVIDGNGKALYKIELANPNAKRGRTACIRNTKNLVIRGVTFRQSPAWCLHLVYCTDVTIENIEVHTKYDEQGVKYEIHNGDGIDIDSCQNVTVKNCLIASQDDGIAVKSGRNEEGRRVGIPSKNIVIENCQFVSGFGAAMGSEMSGGVEDVWVRNCTFKDTFSIASIKAIRGRGNYIRNIHYENCSIDNQSTEFGDTRWFRGAIYLDGFYGEAEFDADTKITIDEGTPIIEDIYFKDLQVNTIAGNAIYLYGLPERHYRNIYMENIIAHGRYGMKVKNIDGLEMKNVQVTCDEGEAYEIEL
ncbi:MAG: glycoside hydrolase family 28 protein [Lachnospiraceae bacterium]|nr:glycoside hydrolase family 28 protein [Lachnospiraceae bacterium]